MRKKKQERKDVKNLIVGAIGGVTISTMLELKDDPKEQEYTTTVNELIGLDESIDVYESFMTLDKSEDVSRFKATNALLNYVLEDNDRSGIVKRCTNAMQTKNGKILLMMTYSSLGTELYAYADRVFDYSINLVFAKQGASILKFICSSGLAHLILGIMSYVNKGDLSLTMTPVPELICCIPLVYNSWKYHKLMKSENHQTPQQLLDQTDRFEKFDLLNRCISDIKNTSDMGHDKFIMNMDILADKLNNLIKTILFAIKCQQS